MKVLMLGWEFPPFISGGLGTACYGLTKAIGGMGVHITFLLPKTTSPGHSDLLKILGAEGNVIAEEIGKLKNVTFRGIASQLIPYVPSGGYKSRFASRSLFKGWSLSLWHWLGSRQHQNYPADMFEEVHHYATKVEQIAALEDFDIVHAHDWMTYPAGIAVAKSGGKPLIVHVHSTEFDRSGEHINQAIYDVERQGMHAATKVITVSNYTKNIIIEHYGIPPEKVEVVYNGVEHNADPVRGSPLNGACPTDEPLGRRADRIVLFLGRITMQKGPEYFIAAAKKVLEKMDNVKFVIAGAGDMMHRMIELAAGMGIGHKVLFTNFLAGAEVDRVFQMADLYVMPSVSEPFGITALEALSHNVPILISKRSGVAEVLSHALKVDFWDINQMANKIIAVLKYAPLQMALRENGYREALKFRWEDAAAKIIQIYQQTLAFATWIQ